jgi:hypothetical protein
MKINHTLQIPLYHYSSIQSNPLLLLNHSTSSGTMTPAHAAHAAHAALGIPIHNDEPPPPPSPSSGDFWGNCLLSGSCLRFLLWTTCFVVIVLVLALLKWKGKI